MNKVVSPSSPGMLEHSSFFGQTCVTHSVTLKLFYAYLGFSFVLGWAQGHSAPKHGRV